MVGRSIERRRQRVLLAASLISVVLSWSAAAVMFQGTPAVVEGRIEPIECHQVSDLIERIRNREAGRFDRRRVQAHLQCCPECQAAHASCSPRYCGAFCKD